MGAIRLTRIVLLAAAIASIAAWASVERGAADTAWWRPSPGVSWDI